MKLGKTDFELVAGEQSSIAHIIRRNEDGETVWHFPAALLDAYFDHRLRDVADRLISGLTGQRS